MSAILFYVCAGLLLAALLLRLLLVRETEKKELSPGEKRFPGWGDGSSAARVAKQVFGSEDRDYVDSLDSMILKRRFFKERKSLALAWVCAARAEASALMRVHRSAVRTSPHLALRVELRIAYIYLSFLIYCSLLELAIGVRGPVSLQRFVEQAEDCAERLYETIGEVFPLAERGDDFDHTPPSGTVHG